MCEHTGMGFFCWWYAGHFGVRWGQKPDVVLLSDLNHGSPHSTLSFIPHGSAHALFLKIFFLLLFPGASPLLNVFWSCINLPMKGPLCHQVAPPFGLLWYFAVFSVASCYCVNKFIFIYTKNQTSACPFSSSPTLTCCGGGGVWLQTWLHLKSQDACPLEWSSLLTWTMFRFVPSLNWEN